MKCFEKVTWQVLAEEGKQWLREQQKLRKEAGPFSSALYPGQRPRCLGGFALRSDFLAFVCHAGKNVFFSAALGIWVFSGVSSRNSPVVCLFGLHRSTKDFTVVVLQGVSCSVSP